MTDELRDSVRRSGVEGRLFALGCLDDLSVQLRGRGLVEADVLLEPGRPDGVEQSERAETVNVSGVLGHLERHLDVRLSSEVVDLGRLRAANQTGSREVSFGRRR